MYAYLSLFPLVLVDTSPPTIHFCPSDVIKQVELGISSISVRWRPPSAIDISGNVSLVFQSHFSGDGFGVGSTVVTYTFADSSDNEASCIFVVTIQEGKSYTFLIYLLKDGKMTRRAFSVIFQNTLPFCTFTVCVYGSLCPLDPRDIFAPLTIYPAAAPGFNSRV